MQTTDIVGLSKRNCCRRIDVLSRLQEDSQVSATELASADSFADETNAGAGLSGMLQFDQIAAEASVQESTVGIGPDGSAYITVAALAKPYVYSPEQLAKIQDSKYVKQGAQLVILPKSIAEMVDSIIKAAGGRKIAGLSLALHGGGGYIKTSNGGIVIGGGNIEAWKPHFTRLQKHLQPNASIFIQGCSSGLGNDGFDFGASLAKVLPGCRIHLGVTGNLTDQDLEHESPFEHSFEGSFHIYEQSGERLMVEDHYLEKEPSESQWSGISNNHAKFLAERLLGNVGNIRSDKRNWAHKVEEVLTAMAAEPGKTMALNTCDAFGTRDLAGLVAYFTSGRDWPKNAQWGDRMKMLRPHFNKQALEHFGAALQTSMVAWDDFRKTNQVNLK